MTVKSKPVKVLFPSGMLGAGFPIESVALGLEMGADAIAIDAGSTDSGPHYLGAGVAKTTAAAVMRDLRVLLTASRSAGIPLVVGSSGTSGTDAGVDMLAEITLEIAREEGLNFTLALIYSEQQVEDLVERLRQGRIHPLPPSGKLDEKTLRSCSHIVGLMGHEPILAALERGADVVLAGRASDTSLVAAIAIQAGLPPGPSWHAAKTVECGDLCTTRPHGAGVFVEIDEEGFTVSPLDAEAACTPTSLAAHMLYENANPFRLVEPSGVLDASAATYSALDARRGRVEGAEFERSAKATIKLEGSARAGYETMAFVGIADPEVLEHIDHWLEGLREMVEKRVQDLLGLRASDYEMQLGCYGHNAILGSLSTNGVMPHEVGVLMRVKAAEQAIATAIAKIANPLLLHMPLPQMAHLPSFAFATSPAEIERGAVYEFVLNHVIEVDDPSQPFRTIFKEVHGV